MRSEKVDFHLITGLFPNPRRPILQVACQDLEIREIGPEGGTWTRGQPDPGAWRNLPKPVGGGNFSFLFSILSLEGGGRRSKVLGEPSLFSFEVSLRYQFFYLKRIQSWGHKLRALEVLSACSYEEVLEVYLHPFYLPPLEANGLKTTGSPILLFWFLVSPKADAENLKMLGLKPTIFNFEPAICNESLGFGRRPKASDDPKEKRYKRERPQEIWDFGPRLGFSNLARAMRRSAHEIYARPDSGSWQRFGICQPWAEIWKWPGWIYLRELEKTRSRRFMCAREIPLIKCKPPISDGPGPQITSSFWAQPRCVYS